MIDLDFVRRQFPAFATPSLNGQSFFENAGGSYMCQQVIDRFNRYFEQRKVQPYYAFAASCDVMRRFIGGDQPDDYSMRKPQRKMYHTNGIVAPSILKMGAGDVVVLCDSSGSVSGREMSFFLGELNAISQDIKPQSITVITFDAEVQTVRRYEQGDEVDKIEVGGRGGTLVSPAFRYVEDNELNVDNMVVFTDLGINDYPDEPHYPVLWISSWANANPQVAVTSAGIACNICAD